MERELIFTAQNDYNETGYWNEVRSHENFEDKEERLRKSGVGGWQETDQGDGQIGLLGELEFWG